MAWGRGRAKLAPIRAAPPDLLGSGLPPALCVISGAGRRRYRGTLDDPEFFAANPGQSQATGIEGNLPRPEGAEYACFLGGTHKPGGLNQDIVQI